MTFQDLVRTLQSQFPNLTTLNSRPTSPYDEDYNCIAWAAGDTDNWWWPDSQNLCFWPKEAPREETIGAFSRAFGLRGYTEQSDMSLESGKKKVAIYAMSDGKPKHAARQLSNGWWASKLGQQIDIEHELAALEGPTYGTVTLILAKPNDN